ncbi:hypothetical protein DVS28_b0131 (plasmid) [Euzebya pacifica]|uniref:Uncharacterized protein n=1 Tax=Euzebya pacifica TaxID=1608957 RepID=A0A346Y604_9ACTN|nr:hypothetical protein [Euzebya pacifica]AXV09901.1 hypothetical protein DVS28_b0131 [Euzebya pacifica]
MSRNEAETGEWVLPSAEVARVKKALRAAHNGVAEAAYREAKAFWKQHGTQSATKYAEAADRFVAQISPRPPSLYGRPDPRAAHQRAVADAVREVLDRIAWHARGGGQALHGATWDDMDGVGWGRKTNRDTTFGDAEASVRINEKTRTLRWTVEENNHAVEHAHDGLLGKTLFGHLAKVKWTRGTGGIVRYLSEYDTDGFGLSNGSRLSQWHGPRGAEVWKQETGHYPYDSPQGKAEAAKAQEKERKKAAAARKRAAAKRQKQAQQAAQKQAAGSSYCGAVKKDASGLCGRKLASGKCPDHGTIGAQMAIGVTTVGSVVPAAAVTADPMG